MRRNDTGDAEAGEAGGVVELVVGVGDDEGGAAGAHCEAGGADAGGVDDGGCFGEEVGEGGVFVDRYVFWG